MILGLPLVLFAVDTIYEWRYDHLLGQTDWQMARLQYHFSSFKCQNMAVASVVPPMRDISYFGGANLRMPKSCEDELRSRAPAIFTLDTSDQDCYRRDVNGTVELCFEKGEVYFGAGRPG